MASSKNLTSSFSSNAGAKKPYTSCQGAFKTPKLNRESSAREGGINRPQTACATCRRKKTKCDGTRPNCPGPDGSGYRTIDASLRSTSSGDSRSRKTLSPAPYAPSISSSPFPLSFNNSLGLALQIHQRYIVEDIHEAVRAAEIILTLRHSTV